MNYGEPTSMEAASTTSDDQEVVMLRCQLDHALDLLSTAKKKLTTAQQKNRRLEKQVDELKAFVRSINQKHLTSKGELLEDYDSCVSDPNQLVVSENDAPLPQGCKVIQGQNRESVNLCEFPRLVLHRTLGRKTHNGRIDSDLARNTKVVDTGLTDFDLAMSYLDNFDTTDTEVVDNEFEDTVSELVEETLGDSLSYTCTICEEETQGSISFVTRKAWAAHMKESHPDEKPFQCSFCPQRFTQQGARSEHERLQHEGGVESLYCEICDKNFARSESYKLHIQRHNPESDFLCDTCGDAFKTKKNLHDHVVRTHKPKVHPCTSCDKAFSTMRLLTVHTKTHADKTEKPYTCSKCGKMRLLTVHTKTHADKTEKPYTCSKCGKSFHRMETLKNHMDRHEQTVNCVNCDVCAKPFASLKALKSHQSVHSGVKPYVCSICGRAFRLGKGLVAHMNTHKGLKPYKCSVCTRQFSTSTALKQHQRIHTGEKQYECYVCKVLYVSRMRLKTHMKLHHPGFEMVSYMCPACPVVFYSRITLEAHLKHNHLESDIKNIEDQVMIIKSEQDFPSLDIGSAILTDKEQRHVRACLTYGARESSETHTNPETASSEQRKKFACEFCNYSSDSHYNTVVHMRRHTGDRPYRCTVCGWNFTHVQGYRRHVKLGTCTSNQI